MRLAGAADADTLARLFHVVKAHYWGAETPSEAEVAAHVKNDILKSRCEIAIAERGGEAVGLATFAVVYPGPKLAGQMVMKDLFVIGAARGGGIGRAMLRWLAGLAVERGCSRLDWTAETDNPRALAFYDRLGARRVPEKVYYRVDDEMLREWAARD